MALTQATRRKSVMRRPRLRLRRRSAQASGGPGFAGYLNCWTRLNLQKAGIRYEEEKLGWRFGPFPHHAGIIEHV